MPQSIGCVFQTGNPLPGSVSLQPIGCVFQSRSFLGEPQSIGSVFQTTNLPVLLLVQGSLSLSAEFQSTSPPLSLGGSLTIGSVSQTTNLPVPLLVQVSLSLSAVFR